MSKSNFILALHELKRAGHHFEDLARTCGDSDSLLYRKSKDYIRRILWIFTDIKTITVFSDEIREAIDKELKSDSFDVPAIAEKAALLSPKKREFVETIIDALLKGESIECITDKNSL